eukprot:gene6131-11521_t
MAAHRTEVNIANFNANLVILQQKFTQFGGIHDNKIPDIANDIKYVRKYVEEQKSSAQQDQKVKLINGLGNVVVTTINSLEDITSQDPIRIMKGGLSIATSIAGIVGGPYGAAAAAVCSILGAVVSACSPKEPDLASKFAEAVAVELQKFHQKLTNERFSGLQHRVRTMNNTLEYLRKQDIDGSAPASSLDNLIDNRLYETDLPQFIGEVAVCFTKVLSKESPKNDVEDCVRAMVVYCNAQATLLILIANIMATLKCLGDKSVALKTILETETKYSRQVLEFLSDEKYLGPVGYLPTEGSKLYLILALRQNTQAYPVVEQFRESQGLSRMPDTDVVVQNAFASDLPVKVECGTAGDHVNGLKFCKDIEPRKSYEHVATGSTFPYWNFSTGGYFIIYLDGKMKNYEKRFNGNIKVYEFALSNPFMGSRKAAIIEKKDAVYSVSGNDCWKMMNSPYFGDPILFTHSNKHYYIKASLGGIRDIFKDEKEDEGQGKNGCRTWRYVFQEFNPADKYEQCVIL